MSEFNPDSPLGQQLKGNICRMLNEMNMGDDANDIAEFILVLISNNRTPAEIVAELSGLFGEAINEDFIQSIFANIVELRNGGGSSNQQQQQNQYQQEQKQAQQTQEIQAISQTPPRQALAQQDEVPRTQGEEHTHKQVGFQQQTIERPSSIPSAPKSFVNRSNGGVGKNFNSVKRGNFAMKNEANFMKALSGFQPGQSLTNISQKPFIQKKAVGRCRQHPYCTNKNCAFSHPTMLCFAYPNCQNAPGTCNYLHPGEDDALFAQVASIKAAKQATREQFYPPRHKQYQAQQQPEISTCKFGALCQKETCPFAHPTPANKNAQISDLTWCPQAKNCTDESCSKAHPSPNHQPSAEEQQSLQQKSLEQCKYGAHCTNYRCPRRHATSPILCREGANCTRVDCLFTHPIDEDCRFAINCMNVNCPYKHPEGRTTGGNNKWYANNQSTSERTFAVPEDEVMEQAPAQEAN